MNLVRKVPINKENEFKYILLLALIQFAHMVDFVVLMPLGPTLMKDLSISPIQFGSLVSSYNFSAAVVGLLFGSIADKYDRKTLLIFSLTGFIVGTFSCALSSGFQLLLFSRIFTGAFGGMMNGLILAIVTDLVPFERRGKAMGVLMSSFSVASVVGVPIGLAIADWSDWHYTFTFIGIFSLLIFVATQLIFPNIKTHITLERESFLKRVGELFKNSAYVQTFIFIFLVSGSMFIIIPYLSPYAVKNMGILEDQLKYMYLVGGLFTVVFARIAGVLTDRIGAFKMFSVIVVTGFGAVLLYTQAGRVSFPTYLAYGTFFMMMASGRMIPCMTLISEVPGDHDRGFFMSVLTAVRACGSASMVIVGGLFISEKANGELMGFDYTGYGAILMGLITIAIAFFINRRLKLSLA